MVQGLAVVQLALQAQNGGNIVENQSDMVIGNMRKYFPDTGQFLLAPAEIFHKQVSLRKIRAGEQDFFIKGFSIPVRRTVRQRSQIQRYFLSQFGKSALTGKAYP